MKPSTVTLLSETHVCQQKRSDECDRTKASILRKRAWSSTVVRVSPCRLRASCAVYNAAQRGPLAGGGVLWIYLAKPNAQRSTFLGGISLPFLLGCIFLIFNKGFVCFWLGCHVSKTTSTRYMTLQSKPFPWKIGHIPYPSRSYLSVPKILGPFVY